jgi:hypothetical protein
MRLEFDDLVLPLMGVPANTGIISGICGHCEIDEDGFPTEVHLNCIRQHAGKREITTREVAKSDPLYSRIVLAIITTNANRITEMIAADMPARDPMAEHRLGSFELLGVR